MSNFDLRKYLAEGKLLKEQLKDIEDLLVKAGLYFDDGILGGVGSGGAGYYDFISDKISGFNMDKFDEKEFNNWYDNFSKEDFNEFIYEKEFSEENEDNIDYDMIGQLSPGIYSVGDQGYAEIYSNGNIQLFAIPMLSSDFSFSGDMENYFEPIFTMDTSGNVVPAMDKDEVKKKLESNKYSIL
jgi:hypothetical protein